MFAGPDYDKEFDDACRDIALERDPELVRGRLLKVEWVLWEAIRGVFIQIASIISALIVLPFFYLLGSLGNLVLGVGAVLAFLVLSTSFYWICRAIFHYEISRHLRSRRFGAGGVQR